MRGLALSTLLALIVACYQYEPRTLPSPSSPEPHPSPGASLRAGFGRADITAPPGVGMFCYGPEGKAARGYRQRLYARALVLEDPAGERLGIIIADLCVISPLLHRLVAERVVDATGIGADRLLLAATHTHSAPSHFFAAKLYNQYGAEVSGYDSVLVDFLVTGMAASVLEAAETMRPARVAWGTDIVWGQTRNRSYEAFVLNDTLPDLPPVARELDLDERQRAVDPRWTMLRVDFFDPKTGDYAPAGAFSIYAIHGTAIPSANDLLDPDVHGFIQRGLERHIDNLNHLSVGSHPRAVHLVANGTAGDVSPDWPQDTRCGADVLRTTRRAAGPRAPPSPEGWCEPNADSTAACMAAARAYVENVGPALAARAIALFDDLGTRLRDDIRVARAFATVPLKGDGAPPELCDEPKVGTAAMGGAPDGYTRYHGWRFLGLLPLGYEQGNSAIKEGKKRCQGEKRYALYPIHELVSGPHGYPEQTQLMVAQVGNQLLGAVPAEVTTTAGDRMRKAMQSEAGRLGLATDSIAIISLANGYLQYITTAEEYAAQRYEGGATIFGPGSAAAFERLLVGLVQDLADDSSSETSTDFVDSIIAYPGKHKTIFPSATSGPPPEDITRTFQGQECRDGTLVVSWIDAYPGRLVPADGPVLRIEREVEPDTWQPAVWDDDPRLEVRAIRAKGKRGYLWEARWRPDRATGKHRVVLLARKDLPEVTGQVFQACR